MKGEGRYKVIKITITIKIGIRIRRRYLICMLLRGGGKNNKGGMGVAIGICWMGVSMGLSIGVVMVKVENRRGV